MPSKKPGKSKKGHRTEKGPELPVAPVIRPHVYEIVQRRLKREKAARIAAWLLYPDSSAYVKDLKLEDPVGKKKKGGHVTESPAPALPAPSGLLLPLQPTTGASLMGLSGMSEADAAKAKKAIIFNFNMREFEIKPEEEAWIEGEPLGDTDSEDGHGSLRKYVTSQEELRAFREQYLLINKRKAAQMAMGTFEAVGQTPSKVNVGGGGKRVRQGVSKINSRTVVNQQPSNAKLPIPEVKPSSNTIGKSVSATKDIGKVKSTNHGVA